jgi:hypothetical protein
VTLGRDATKTIVETRDREAADTQAESAEVMMNHLGEARHRLWRAPEILHAEMKGEAGMSETAGMEGVIDDLEERKSTLAVHCLMSKTHLPVGQCRVSHHLHRHRTVRLPHKNGSVVLRAATTKDSTADVVAEVAAVNSEAVDVKTSAMQQVVDLAAKTTSCSSQAWTVGSAGMRMLPGQGRRAVSTRKGDGAGDRMTWWLLIFYFAGTDGRVFAILDGWCGGSVRYAEDFVAFVGHSDGVFLSPFYLGFVVLQIICVHERNAWDVFEILDSRAAIENFSLELRVDWRWRKIV